MVPVAVEALRGSGVHVAERRDRVPARPRGLAVKLADTRDAVAAGADEIDMVIDRGAFLSGRYLEVFEEIVAVKRGVRSTAGAPQGDPRDRRAGTYDNVRRASWLAMLAGGRLHQDLDRQDRAGGDAAGDAGDARGGARLPRARPAGRSA